MLMLNKNVTENIKAYHTIFALALAAIAVFYCVVFCSSRKDDDGKNASFSHSKIKKCNRKFQIDKKDDVALSDETISNFTKKRFELYSDLTQNNSRENPDLRLQDLSIQPAEATKLEDCDIVLKEENTENLQNEPILRADKTQKMNTDKVTISNKIKGTIKNWQAFIQKKPGENQTFKIRLQNVPIILAMKNLIQEIKSFINRLLLPYKDWCKDIVFNIYLFCRTIFTRPILKLKRWLTKSNIRSTSNEKIHVKEIDCALAEDLVDESLHAVEATNEASALDMQYFEDITSPIASEQLEPSKSKTRGTRIFKITKNKIIEEITELEDPDFEVTDNRQTVRIFTLNICTGIVLILRGRIQILDYIDFHRFINDLCDYYDAKKDKLLRKLGMPESLPRNGFRLCHPSGQDKCLEFLEEDDIKPGCETKKEAVIVDINRAKEPIDLCDEKFKGKKIFVRLYNDKTLLTYLYYFSLKLISLKAIARILAVVAVYYFIIFVKKKIF